jgi:hypothetical protein
MRKRKTNEERDNFYREAFTSWHEKEAQEQQLRLKREMEDSMLSLIPGRKKLYKMTMGDDDYSFQGGGGEKFDSTRVKEEKNDDDDEKFSRLFLESATQFANKKELDKEYALLGEQLKTWYLEGLLVLQRRRARQLGWRDEQQQQQQQPGETTSSKWKTPPPPRDERPSSASATFYEDFNRKFFTPGRSQFQVPSGSLACTAICVVAAIGFVSSEKSRTADTPVELLNWDQYVVSGAKRWQEALDHRISKQKEKASTAHSEQYQSMLTTAQDVFRVIPTNEKENVEITEEIAGPLIKLQLSNTGKEETFLDCKAAIFHFLSDRKTENKYAAAVVTLQSHSVVLLKEEQEGVGLVATWYFDPAGDARGSTLVKCGNSAESFMRYVHKRLIPSRLEIELEQRRLQDQQQQQQPSANSMFNVYPPPRTYQPRKLQSIQEEFERLTFSMTIFSTP